MKRLITGLGLLMMVQLGLAAWSWQPEDRAFDEPRALLATPLSDISQIVVETPSNDPVVLAKVGPAWVMVTEAGFPANPGRVDALLQTVSALKVRVPLVTDPESHVRLRVAADDYDRKLSVLTEDTTETVYVGVGGREKTFVRLEGQDEVYLVPQVDVFTLPVQVSELYPSHYVPADDGSISRLTVKTPEYEVEFIRTPQGILSPQTEGQPLVQGRARAALYNLTTLPLMRPVPGLEVPPTIVFRWTAMDYAGQPEDIVIHIGEVDGTWYAMRQGALFGTEFSERLVQRLRGFDLNELVATGPESRANGLQIRRISTDQGMPGE